MTIWKITIFGTDSDDGKVVNNPNPTTRNAKPKRISSRYRPVECMYQPQESVVKRRVNAVIRDQRPENRGEKERMAWK